MRGGGRGMHRPRTAPPADVSNSSSHASFAPDDEPQRMASMTTDGDAAAREAVGTSSRSGRTLSLDETELAHIAAMFSADEDGHGEGDDVFESAFATDA